MPIFNSLIYRCCLILVVSAIVVVEMYFLATFDGTAMAVVAIKCQRFWVSE